MSASGFVAGAIVALPLVSLGLAAMNTDAPAGGEGEKTQARREEAKVLEYLDYLHERQSRGMMNVPPEDGKLLRIMTQASGAKHVVEIGTSNGYSGIWICLGLRNTGGKLTTFEIDEGRAKLARENFKKAGCEDRVRIVMGDAHQEITKLTGPIDLVFIDADKPGYADYLRKLLPLVRPGGLILAHNTTSQGGQMRDFLEAITTNPDLETVLLNPTDRGMSVTLKKR